MNLFKKILIPFWVWSASIVASQASTPSMTPYTIKIQNHILHFSLPDEMARELSKDGKIIDFSPDDPIFKKNGFIEITGTLYDIKGPFWAGAYGSLRFQVIVQKRNPKFGDNITTLEDLEHYIKQWNQTIIGRESGCVFSIKHLNQKPVIQRKWNGFNNPKNKEPDDLEIFSLPISNEIFIDIGINIMAWESGIGKENKWKPKAEALREAIKDTIILE